VTVRVGINGFGRIGRNFYRAARKAGADVEVVAVNDLVPTETNAHLLKWDSTQERLDAEVLATAGGISVAGKEIRVFAERDPKAIPWGDLGVDVVIESTGHFTDGEAARAHIEGGARKVIISAPATNVDATFVVGVNDNTYNPATHTIVSTPRAPRTASSR